MTVIWLGAALADVARIARHVHEENPLAARRITRELLLVGDSLALFPYRGRAGRSPGTRELVAVTPYVLVYEIADDGAVTILRIWHAAQDR